LTFIQINSNHANMPGGLGAFCRPRVRLISIRTWILLERKGSSFLRTQSTYRWLSNLIMYPVNTKNEQHSSLIFTWYLDFGSNVRTKPFKERQIDRCDVTSPCSDGMPLRQDRIYALRNSDGVWGMRGELGTEPLRPWQWV
jgi:hypothetical protein